MPSKIPISLIIDDSCPLVHVYRAHYIDVHHKQPVTEDGRPMPEFIPNSFLDRFCDVAARRGMAGKFSIVPAPGGRGDVIRGIEGHDPSATCEWLDTVRARLSARWDFCPEGITHNLAVDLVNGGYFDESENAWSQRQDRSTLTPYLVRQLELLRGAGIDCTGVTSPWVFALNVEAEYLAAMAAAQKSVYGRDFSWYFLHAHHRHPETRPWIAFARGAATIVSIPCTTGDVFWKTIHCGREDPGWIHSIADELLTPDGREGQIRRVLDAGGWPILVTHWQSLFSNGLETGLSALDEVGRRIGETLVGEVEWLNCMEMSRRTVAGWRAAAPAGEPRPA